MKYNLTKIANELSKKGYNVPEFKLEILFNEWDKISHEVERYVDKNNFDSYTNEKEIKNNFPQYENLFCWDCGDIIEFDNYLMLNVDEYKIEE